MIRILLLVVLVAGCGDAAERDGERGATDSPAGAESGTDAAAGPDGAREGGGEASSVTVHFLRGEDVVAVRRPVAAGADPETRLRQALEALLEGPTPEERERGLVSPAGPAGSEVLDSVRIHPDGRAVIDFGDLPSAFPGGSASAAGIALMESLERTVFQLAEVREALYRVRGSCDAFWNWLQRECEVVTRSGESRGESRRPRSADTPRAAP